MPDMIAYCGLDCSTCGAYQATQANDRAALEAVVEQWLVAHKHRFAVDEIICDGCTTAEGRKCSHCAQCAIFACARERGLENCAHCPDYGCEKVAGLLRAVPDAKARLDAIHAGLGLGD